MSEGEKTTAGMGLGARLAAAREAAGLSLPEAAERLHLDAATLQGLEREHFHALGAAVYVRGHLRRYAELLGLPVTEIEAAYGLSATAVSGMPDLRRVATPLEAAASPSWAVSPGPAAAVAVLLVLSALVWWAMRMPHTPRTATTTTTLALASGASTPVASASPPPSVSERSDPVPTREAPRGVAPSVHSTPAASAAAAAPAAPLPPGSVRLGLLFRENSWVEIYDAAGAKLLYELASAGTERALHGSAPLRILLGNPSGVDLSVDGRAVTFDEPPHGDLPLRLSLDGSGRVLEVRAAVTAGAASGPSGPHP